MTHCQLTVVITQAEMSAVYQHQWGGEDRGVGMGLGRHMTATSNRASFIFIKGENWKAAILKKLAACFRQILVRDAPLQQRRNPIG